MTRIWGPLRTVGLHIGRRGTFLLFLALLDVIFGYALLQPLPFGLSQNVLYQPFIAIMPLGWWATWWCATSALTATAAVWHRARVAAFADATLLKAGWAAGYLIGWREHLPAYARGYQSAILFGAFAFITVVISGWRENGQ
jgi:hypothetical protein